MLRRIKKACLPRKGFILSFVLTYAITIGMTVIAIFLKLDEETEKTILFHNIKITHNMYMWACVLEAIIPTTITFCGASLLFQTAPHRIGFSGTFTLISISLLASLYIAFSQISDKDNLFPLLIVAMFFNVFPLFWSYHSYIELGTETNQHKIEISDGLITGSMK